MAANTLQPGFARANPACRLIAVIEPWYDWGATFIERLDGEGEGPGRWISLQWFGLSITVFAGRVPSKREG